MSMPAAGQPPATRHSPWFRRRGGRVVTCLLAANIVSVKLISLHGLILPAGIVIFRSATSRRRADRGYASQARR